MADELIAAEERLYDLIAKTSKREQVLTRETFLELPSKLQNQLAVLQKQSEPKERTLDAFVAAESNLREYNARLDEALALKRQIDGERGRKIRARKRAARSASIRVLVASLAVGGFVIFYKMQAAAKAEACGHKHACEAEGLCSGKLNLTAFEWECAARGEDCRKSIVCSTQGMCTPKEGACHAQTAEDCLRSKNCVEQGLCSPFAGTCVAGSSDDCAASRACHEHGACVEVGGRCINPGGLPTASAAVSGSAAPKGPKKAPTVPKRPRLRARP